MKWFKHLTQSHTDEKLAELVSDCGLEGYGFWWMLMEIVASQCVDEKCHVTYSLPQWSRLLYCHHHKVSKYLGKLGVTGIVRVEYLEGKIRVTIPNLLKYRDEYTRKSGHSQEVIPPKKENKKDKKVNQGRLFAPPSLEEVKGYCSERKNDVDPEKWLNHYQAKNWMIGKNKMKDWQAAVRTWEKTTKEKAECTTPAWF